MTEIVEQVFDFEGHDVTYGGSCGVCGADVDFLPGHCGACGAVLTVEGEPEEEDS